MFTQLLAAYDRWTDEIVWIVKPITQACIDAIGDWLGLTFSLDESWKHVLIVLVLYMTNYISNTLNGRPLNAIPLVIVLAPLATFGAAGYGVMLTTGVFFSTVFPAVALTAFAIVASASTTLFYPPSKQTRREVFHYYWGRTVRPFVNFGTIVLVAAFAADWMFAKADAESFSLILLAFFVLALALNLLIRGSAGERPKGLLAKIKYWFSGSFGPRLGARILSVYLLVAVQLAFDFYVLQPFLH